MGSMTVSRILLEMLTRYDVEHVFGLPGETTLPWYKDWHDYPQIEHVLVRDQRSGAFMAEAYTKVKGKPGVCEAPSPGAAHVLPAVAEARKGSVPLIVFTTDVPLDQRRRNMLTEFDQSSVFEGVTKESITLTTASEVPRSLRRAFRVATTDKPGPVHIRIPQDLFSAELTDPDLSVNRQFGTYPGTRPVASESSISRCRKMLWESAKPLLLCGQGALASGASGEIKDLAETFGALVGTTMTGKGIIEETHPLSVGVVGSRGGTEFSNGMLKEAELIFFIGCNTDSAATSHWQLPAPETDKKLIQLDISAEELGNNYLLDVAMSGDAKATVRKILQASEGKEQDQDRGKVPDLPYLREASKRKDEHRNRLSSLMKSEETPIHPLRFVSDLAQALPDNHVIACDPGVSAIYPSAYLQPRNPGRSILFNYSLGALGYAIPAAIGAYHASQDSCVIALTGDGSFGFTAGELETIQRLNTDINIVLFDNGSFGWIRAAASFSDEGQEPFQTDFTSPDYPAIAKGFGLEGYRVSSAGELLPTLEKAFGSDRPTLIELPVKTEDRQVPPVPSWIERASSSGLDYVY